MGKMKEIGKILFAVVILGAIFGVLVSIYVDDFVKSEREPAEQVVLEKQSKKGLFFGPRYQVITNYDHAPSYVTKKEFEALDLGDKVKGYATNTQHFFTKMDDVFAYSILIFLGLMFGPPLILCLIVLFATIVDIGRKPTKQDKPRQAQNLRKRKRKVKKKRRKLEFWMVLLGGFLAIGLVHNGLYTLNLFYKLIPIGQTTVEAKIIDRESDINITSRGNYSTHYLTVLFPAEDGETYRVTKEVSGSTYNKWANESSVEIRYRNKNPYDIFIPITSVLEVISVLLHRWTFLYVLILFIIIGSITYYLEGLPYRRAQRRRRRQEKERQQKKQRREEHYRRLRQQHRQKKQSKK